MGTWTSCRPCSGRGATGCGPRRSDSPRAAGRRAPGLRREELSVLAGVSVDYIVRLEQGRARHPSAQLLAALARALRVTDAERDHLFQVAGVAVPSGGVVPRHLTPGVQRIIDRLGDVPLAVHSAAWDLLHWNPLWAAVTGDPSSRRGLERNVAWRHFMEHDSVIDYDDEHAEDFSHDLVADLRAAYGRYPKDTQLATLVGRLRAECAEFERRWAHASVALHRASTKTATSTPVGAIRIDCDVLTVPGSDLRVVVYTAVPGSEDADKLELLRVVGAHTFPETGTPNPIRAAERRATWPRTWPPPLPGPAPR